MSEKIRAFLLNVLSNKDITATWNFDLFNDGVNQWSIVAAYMDYDGTGDYTMYAKIAYRPNNSVMSEYDMDWIMPYDENTGEVFDTEISFDPDSNICNQDIYYLERAWETIRETYIEDDEDYLPFS